MVKNIKNYLPFYLGCECVVNNSEKKWFLTAVQSNSSLYVLRNNEDSRTGNWCTSNDFKLKLRPLSDLSNEEFASLYYLSEGVFDYEIQELKRVQTNEIYLRFGKHSEKIFGYFKLIDGDVRVNSGISFYVRNFLIQESLVVNESGIATSESHFNKEQVIIAGNQSELFLSLLSKHFDLFGLIEAGLAIDATTLNQTKTTTHD